MIEKMEQIVLKAGELLLDQSLNGKKGHWEGTQFKAKADRLTHHNLKQALQDMDGAIPVISEEDPMSLVHHRPKKYWLIDPIDGTASFAQGYSGFVTQVALIENHQPIMAAIYAPKLDDLYVAVKGEGASLNGSKLKLRKSKEISSVIDNTPSPQGIAKAVYDHFSCSRYVECGSIALKICKVADGTADLFIKDVEVKDWDVAAPHLILEEAGGALTDIQGMAFNYKGPYKRDGVVASHSPIQGKKVIGWYKGEYREEQQN
ncbi:3'(2'),5'-bisphosphate nucleotidase CysQ [Halobacillus sp. Marseille-Q1614]|uniref:3'(2'),5'-bisphosphate nucleotidase CysQ family protein n=1 Tax=Halobacillus sp. Marseille-Q1614 TaxID=2709134 RepID=UPI00156D59E7|nr:inositol monophosphatase family protein [Halobacillus sp. Marseille-Q1614]